MENTNDLEEFISYFLIENPNNKIEALAEKIQQLSKLTKDTKEDKSAFVGRKL